MTGTLRRGQLQAAEADTPIFARNGEILFSMKEGAFNYIFRMKQDGTDLRKAIPDPIARLISLSPNDRWIVAAIDSGNPARPQIVSGYPMGGGVPRVLCRVCAVGSFEIYPPIVSWSFDQKWMYISLTYTGASDNPKTIVILLDPWRCLSYDVERVSHQYQITTNAGRTRARASQCVSWAGRLELRVTGDSVPDGTSYRIMSALIAAGWRGVHFKIWDEQVPEPRQISVSRLRCTEAETN